MSPALWAVAVVAVLAQGLAVMWLVWALLLGTLEEIDRRRRKR